MCLPLECSTSGGVWPSCWRPSLHDSVWSASPGGQHTCRSARRWTSCYTDSTGCQSTAWSRCSRIAWYETTNDIISHLVQQAGSELDSVLYSLFHVIDREAGEVGDIILLHIWLVLVLILCHWWSCWSHSWCFWKHFSISLEDTEIKGLKENITRDIQMVHLPAPEVGVASGCKGLMMPVLMSLDSRSLTSTWPKWFSGWPTCGAARTEQAIKCVHLGGAVMVLRAPSLLCCAKGTAFCDSNGWLRFPIMFTWKPEHHLKPWQQNVCSEWVTINSYVTHRLLQADSRGNRVVEGGWALLVERWGWLHVEVSRLLQVRLGWEPYWSCGELRVHGLWEPLGGHAVLKNGRSHLPHGGLWVVLGSKPHRALLARSWFVEWGAALKGCVKPRALLHWPIKAHRTRTFKAHGTHLVWRALKAHGPLLLEAYWSRPRPRGHVVKALHWAIKVARGRCRSLKP